jgi:PTH1 family peptidyl-tRNA hydrolase
LVGKTFAPVPMLLAKPVTFMNLSGQSVRGLADFHKVDVADILIVADDVNLPLGRLRARPGGSAGGHNGFKSVAEHLGTDQFARLRIGVGRGDDRRDLADHVLAKFDSDERVAIDEAIVRAADAVEVFVSQGIAEVMNRFNAGPRESPEQSGEEKDSQS